MILIRFILLETVAESTSIIFLLLSGPFPESGKEVDPQQIPVVLCRALILFFRSIFIQFPQIC